MIPRPETEHVVERVVKLYRAMESERLPVVVDAGTGSGCIAVAVAAELPRARLIATEASAAALAVAASNASRLGARQVKFCRCDWLGAIGTAVADLVMSNPPYIPLGQAEALQREVRDFEPRHAVFAGPLGLEIYATLLPEAARVLRPGGWAVLELGYNMADAVGSLLSAEWDQVQFQRDLAGNLRVISARRAR